MDKRRTARPSAEPSVLRATRLDPLQDMALRRCIRATDRSITDVIKAGLKHECELGGIPWPEDQSELTTKAS